MDESTIKQMVDESAAKLAEHFDSVQVFVTIHDGGKERTHSYETGRGNFYSRYGQVSEWVSMQDQLQRNEAVRRDNDDDE
jgi:hypothetical protein